MKELTKLSVDELDDLFRQATGAARKVAKARNLPEAGIDQNGKLVEPLETDDKSEVNYEHGSVA